METFIGYVKTPQDALVIFEACRQGQLNRVQRRLSSKERIHIQSGSVFAWDEKEAGMRRWTDGKTWSPSRVLGSFLTYRELDTKRRPRRPASSSSPSSSSSSSSSTASCSSPHQHHYNNKISSANALCSYKQDGLIKQSFSICTANNQKLHLISYYCKKDVLSGRLHQPTADPVLGKIVIPKGLYPDLNPLDTSGGHSATLHNMRQQQQLQAYRDLQRQSDLQHGQNQSEDDDEDDEEDNDMEDNTNTMMIRDDHRTSSSPPSLSSSPCTSDEDIMMDLLPSPAYSPFPAQPSSYHQQSYCTSSPSVTLLPIQDIAWGKIPSSEDQRQLQALQGLLKL